MKLSICKSTFLRVNFFDDFCFGQQLNKATETLGVRIILSAFCCWAHNALYR